MKKILVLASLFLLPLVFYIFLSKGIYKYSNLPVLTKEVADVTLLQHETSYSFKDRLTVVCFLGENINEAKASLFNLNEVIYKRYYQKPYFQMVAIIPEKSKSDYSKVIEELSNFTDTVNWQFIYADAEKNQALFESFKTPFQLKNGYSEYAFIVDMKLRLRGRKDDEDTKDGKLYGYNMRSISTLKNKMKDDIDIIYYQLKKSAEKEKRRKKEL